MRRQRIKPPAQLQCMAVMSRRERAIGCSCPRESCRYGAVLPILDGASVMSHLLDATAKGVYAISATPFSDAGEIDWASVESLIEFYLQCGVSGLTILGMMGEAQKLSEEESARRVNERVPVIVGVSNAGTANLVRLSRTAMEAG